MDYGFLIHVLRHGLTGWSVPRGSLDWNFPGGPVAKTLRSQCKGPGSIPGWGNRSHMPQLSFLATTKDLACLNEDQRSCMLLLRPGTVK